MKIKNALYIIEKMNTIEITEQEFSKALEDNIGILYNQISNAFNRILAKQPELIVAGIEFDDSIIYEGARDSIRMNLLKNAFLKVFKIKKIPVKKWDNEFKNSVIKSLVELKKEFLFKDPEKVGKPETKDIRLALNEATEQIFTENVLKEIFERVSGDAVLFKAIRDKYINLTSRKIAKSKTFRLNTEKKISETDLTFIPNTAGKLIRHPNGGFHFPDWKYIFPKNKNEYDEGDKMIEGWVEGIKHPGYIYIEMKGDKSPRIVLTQTTSEVLIDNLNERYLNKLRSLNINESVVFPYKALREIFTILNLHMNLEVPIVFIKSATNKGFVFKFPEKKDKYTFKRLKRSISIVIIEDDEIGKKKFSIEFTGTAYDNFFQKK